MEVGVGEDALRRSLFFDLLRVLSLARLPIRIRKCLEVDSWYTA